MDTVPQGSLAVPPWMKAVVMHQPGGPEVLKLERRPVPTPQPGEVLIRVESFGLNRSELFTRQGHSPGVKFPRILGIEAVGTVACAPGGEFRAAQTVATVMGGMGRQFDGGYAEYTRVPARQVQAINTTLAFQLSDREADVRGRQQSTQTRPSAFSKAARRAD